jgi:hypothetical protein
MNVPAQEVLKGGDIPDLEIPTTYAQIETLSMKRIVLQEPGQRKKC